MYFTYGEEHYKVESLATAKKRHTCVLCGAVYQYSITRRRSAERSSVARAKEVSQDRAQAAIEKEVDRRPCPSCGLLQPEMVGQPRMQAHGALIGATVILGATVVVLFIFYGVPIAAMSSVAAVVAAMIAAGHILAVLYNPNRDLAANLAIAQEDCEKGVTQLVEPGSSDHPDSIPMSNAGFWPATILLAVSVPAFYCAAPAPGATTDPSWYAGVAELLLLLGGGLLLYNAWKLLKGLPTEILDFQFTSGHGLRRAARARPKVDEKKGP